MEHPGIRLARGDLTRLTNQTAVCMSILMGHDAVQEPTLRGLAATCMLGAARGSILDITIAHIDNRQAAGVASAVRNYNSWRDGAARTAHRTVLRAVSPQLGLEGVLACVDGAASLRTGRAGTTSIIAAGATDAFVLQDFELRERPAGPVSPSYLIVAIGAHALSDEMQKELDAWERSLPLGQLVTGATLLEHFVADSSLLKTILARLKTDGEEWPMVGTVLEGSNYSRWKPRFPARALRRGLEGSTVVAAIAAYLGHIGVGLAPARLPQVIQMAVAARALHGRLYAIPLHEVAPGTDPQIDKVTVPEGAVLRREREFVPGASAMLAMTSVTEVCILDRVRFRRPLVASTEVLAMSIGSHGVSRTTHTFDLEHATFYMPDGTPATALDVLDRFEELAGL